MFKGMFDYSVKELKKIEKVADKVMLLEKKYKELSDEELQGKTAEFREMLRNGSSLDDILVDAFATAREGANRVLGMMPYKVQVMGSLSLHYGNISEMRTGEGKTLTATMAAYLNALPEGPQGGVHVITVNEYLSSRDAEEMGKLYKWLGLTVGLNLRDLSKEEKRAQYACDIMYTTNSELGFDYLRDHMVMYEHEIAQCRGLNYCIIDETDSILVDEARTPLIISGGQKRTANLYAIADQVVKRLSEDDYEIDEKSRHASLTEEGIAKVEKMLNLENLYDVVHVQLVHRLNNALKANYIFGRDIEYVVHEDEILLVDGFTGRIMQGRQYSDGLHQAIEAKEGVKIKEETSTIATITYQNFFRMYRKLSGMTGTAKTEEEEFRDIYNMYVIEIPTNKPVIRKDDTDLIFATMEAKYQYLCQDIKERHEKGQPVLVGTNSIESSEIVSQMLTKMKVPHELLNAKQHEREALIVEQAGQRGAVTIATNMAGRGTDIKLGEGVKELGGLAVLGAERNESRRIDNQLRGRAGRQGDPGYSRFYVSGDDMLLKRFGDGFKNRIASVTTSKKFDGEKPISMKLFSKIVASAQSKIEGHNYDIRKNVLKYDEVLNKQRTIIYTQREEILFEKSIENLVSELTKNAASIIIAEFVRYDEKTKKHTIDFEAVYKYLDGGILPPGEITYAEIEEAATQEKIETLLCDKIAANLETKKNNVPEEVYQEFLKAITLRVVDTCWMEHIDQMSALRQSIGLQSYGQINPIREYQTLGFDLFETMTARIAKDSTRFLLRAEIRQNLEREEVAPVQIANDGKEHIKTPKKVEKVGRNDECPCGSGLKYKDCCGK